MPGELEFSPTFSVKLLHPKTPIPNSVYVQYKMTVLLIYFFSTDSLSDKMSQKFQTKCPLGTNKTVLQDTLSPVEQKICTSRFDKKVCAIFEIFCAINVD